MTTEHPAKLPRPLTLTRSPKLDNALRLGWESWERAASHAGLDVVARWLRTRLDDGSVADECIEPLATLLRTESDPEDPAVARAEFAELLEGEDDELADALWEGVLAFGRDTGDPEYLFEATKHLATIAEAHGDPLAAAEYYIEFLNWRREGDHNSDSEPVELAFEETIRLAEADGDPRAAALYTHRQVLHHRLAEADDDRATTGDWERTSEPYESWA